MKIGFSIFPGWKEIKEDQIALVKKARDLGFSEIFMGIGPGSHWRTPASEAFEIAKDILKEANKLDYYVFFDINPEIIRELSSSPKDLSKIRNAGFKGIRADYGFSKEEILEMSKQMIVELNPMEITIEELDYITKNADPERIKATHNYYPLIYSGLSKETFLEKNKIFKERGIEIGAFISNPKFNMRTTLEILRFAEPFDSANYLSKFVDRVLIGDPIPDDEWLKQVSEVYNSKTTKIRIKLYAKDEETLNFIKNKFSVTKNMENAIVCYTNAVHSKSISNNCYTKIFKNAVTIKGREIWIFTKDLGVAPFMLIGEIDDINLEILKLSREIVFVDKSK
ncbi:MAG: MupG family TIM beta-alpha barrel fold protein [Saccharolobus sp.]